MNTQWSIGLEQTYFDSPHYLVVQYWVYSHSVTLALLIQQGHVYHYIIFEGIVGTAQGTFCVPNSWLSWIILMQQCLCCDCFSSFIKFGCLPHATGSQMSGLNSHPWCQAFTTYLMIPMMPMNLSLCLYALLYVIIILYHTINTVMGVISIFILSYICCLLILFPSKYVLGRGRYSECLLFLPASMPSLWGLQMIHPDITDYFTICTGHGCHEWFVCCLLSLIFLANFDLVCYIMGSMTFSNFSFPALER